VRRGLVLIAIAGCGRIGFEPIGGGDGGGTLDGVIPPSTNVAFVLSTDILPYQLGGTAAADTLCNQHAVAAGIGGSYIAWLSTSSINAIDRLGQSRGWVRRDGTPLVDTIADLVAGKFFYPLTIDELGNTVAFGKIAITGTLADGTSSGADCNGYTAVSSVGYGGVGYSTVLWTQINNSTTECGDLVRIYCFGVGETTPVKPAATTARRAFLLAAPWASGGGISSADTACQGEAGQANLTGTFRALLGQTGTTAISRFSLSGTVWTRVDDVALASTTADFSAGTTIATLNVTAAGAYVPEGNGFAWTGGLPDAIGTAQTTCTDWASMSAATTGRSGSSVATSSAAFDQVIPLGCSQAAGHVYCLEP
jgi:hypothetical protein